MPLVLLLSSAQQEIIPKVVKQVMLLVLFQVANLQIELLLVDQLVPPLSVLLPHPTIDRR
jgi:hypothetical protein